MYKAVAVQVVFPKNKDGRKEFMFKTVNSFKAEGSWKNLTSTAEIVLSKKLFFDPKGKVFQLIKSGDPIRLTGGYNGEYFDEFVGFVSRVKDDLPVTLYCEDNMYLLKRVQVNKSYSSVKLETLLKDIVPSQFKIDAMDVELGSLLISRSTVAQVLQELKDKFGIYSYFVGDTLVSGKIYFDNPNTQVVKYEFTVNVISNTLEYRNKEDLKLKVTMTSHMSDGKRKHVTVGDPEGQEQKLVCSNIESETELKKLAEKELARLQIDGYSGSIKGYAVPFVKHGYTVTIINKEFPERQADCYVDSVTTILDDHGHYTRDVTLGPRAAKQS